MRFISYDLPKSTFTIIKTYGDLFSVGFPFDIGGVTYEELEKKVQSKFSLTFNSSTAQALKAMRPGEILWVEVSEDSIRSFTPSYIYSY